ncbi:hypothetical protein CRYUN_Cryun33cG0029600 [Craigia yunnanensis]
MRQFSENALRSGEWGIYIALEEYQSVWLPVTSKQVQHSRQLGRIKQGLDLPNREPFDQNNAKSRGLQ